MKHGLKKVISLTTILAFVFIALFSGSMATSAASTDPSLIAHYTFDDENVDAVTDVSGNGNDGNLMFDATFVDGKVGKKALHFDGSGDFTVEPTALASIKDTKQFTMTMWIKPKAGFACGNFFGRTGERLFMGNEGNIGGFMPGWNYIGSEEGQRGKNVLTMDKWNHIGITYDAAGHSKIYVNGVVVYDGQKPLNDDLVSDEKLSIGGNGWGGFIEADMDDIYLYNRALSEDEINAMVFPTGLIADWTFDEGDGDTIHDATGTQPDVDKMFDGEWRPGVVGKSALYFDGSGNIPIPAEGLKSLNETKQCTISLFVKPDKNFNCGNFLGRTGTRFFMGTDGSIGGFMPGWNYIGSGESAVDAFKTPVRQGQWNHICFVYDQLSSKIYVNGALVFDKVKPFANDLASDEAFSIDGNNWGGFMGGTYDELRIYNTAASAAQVKSLMKMAKYASIVPLRPTGLGALLPVQ